MRILQLPDRFAIQCKRQTRAFSLLPVASVPPAGALPADEGPSPSAAGSDEEEHAISAGELRSSSAPPTAFPCSAFKLEHDSWFFREIHKKALSDKWLSSVAEECWWRSNNAFVSAKPEEYTKVGRKIAAKAGSTAGSSSVSVLEEPTTILDHVAPDHSPAVRTSPRRPVEPKSSADGPVTGGEDDVSQTLLQRTFTAKPPPYPFPKTAGLTTGFLRFLQGYSVDPGAGGIKVVLTAEEGAAASGKTPKFGAYFKVDFSELHGMEAFFKHHPKLPEAGRLLHAWGPCRSAKACVPTKASDKMYTSNPWAVFKIVCVAQSGTAPSGPHPEIGKLLRGSELCECADRPTGSCPPNPELVSIAKLMQQRVLPSTLPDRYRLALVKHSGENAMQAVRAERLARKKILSLLQMRFFEFLLLLGEAAAGNVPLKKCFGGWDCYRDSPGVANWLPAGLGSSSVVV